MGYNIPADGTAVANVCTCPNGTPTVFNGVSTKLLCETTATVDCSACDTEYTISATPATGLQTCASCTLCGATEYETSACTSTSDRLCSSGSEIYFGVETYSSTDVYVATKPFKNFTDSTSTTVVKFDRSSLIPIDQVTVPINFVAGIHYHDPNVYVLAKDGVWSINWETKTYEIIITAPTDISIYASRSSINRVTKQIYVLGLYNNKKTATYALLTYNYETSKKNIFQCSVRCN